MSFCPQLHYWPGTCQQCDTAWDAESFICGIFGHVWARDSCAYCAQFA